MVQKPIFRSHFENSRHFETKQKSTRFETGSCSPYIKINFCKVWRKSKMCNLRYLQFCKTFFSIKLLHFSPQPPPSGRSVAVVSEVVWATAHPQQQNPSSPLGQKFEFAVPNPLASPINRVHCCLSRSYSRHDHPSDSVSPPDHRHHRSSSLFGSARISVPQSVS
jgi:hypothetical protein